MRADFFTRRYCLYTVDRRGRPLRGEIDHAPWRLRPARATFHELDLDRLLGGAVTLEGPPEDLQVAEPLSVVAWMPTRL